MKDLTFILEKLDPAVTEIEKIKPPDTEMNQDALKNLTKNLASNLGIPVKEAAKEVKRYIDSSENYRYNLDNFDEYNTFACEKIEALQEQFPNGMSFEVLEALINLTDTMIENKKEYYKHCYLIQGIIETMEVI